MNSTFEIPIGAFQPGSTILHGIDPRAKILTLSAVLMGIVLTDNWRGLLWITLFSIVTALMTEKTARLMHDVWSFRIFFFFTILMHLLFDRGGTPLLHIYKFEVTSAGLNDGIFFSVKIGLMAMLGGLFSRTTHPSDLSKGIELLLPSNGRVARFFGRPGIVIGLALRMLPTILAEAERIRTAQIARGLKLTKGGIFKRIRSLMPLIGPLLTATLRRGDIIHRAMISRGFALDQKRTPYITLRMNFTDWGVLTGGVIFSTMAVML